MRDLAHTVWVLVRKDLTLEWRTRETLLATLSFALLMLAIFTVVEVGAADAEAVAPAILWVGLAFAASAGLHRSMAIEGGMDALDGIRTTPVGRDLFLISKSLANFVVLLLATVILLVAFIFLFNLELYHPLLALVQLLVVLGFSVAGTMFAVLTHRAHTRQVLLALLFVPVVSPLIIAAVESTRLALAGEPLTQFWPWIALVVVCDLVFTASMVILANVILDDD